MNETEKKSFICSQSMRINFPEEKSSRAHMQKHVAGNENRENMENEENKKHVRSSSYSTCSFYLL